MDRTDSSTVKIQSDIVPKPLSHTKVFDTINCEVYDHMQ